MATEEQTFDEGGDTILTLTTNARDFYWISDTLHLDISGPELPEDRDDLYDSDSGDDLEDEGSEDDSGTESSSVEGSLESPGPPADPAEEATDVAREAGGELLGAASYKVTEQVSEEIPTQHPADPDDTNLGQPDNVDDQAVPETYCGPEDEIDDFTDIFYETATFRMKVSSRHLILASPIFKEMLAGPFAEGAVDDRGLYQIGATEWDHEALTIVLNIIHGRHRQVPKALDLEMFAKVAIIVDYYQCHEVIDLFTHLWVGAFRGKFPNQYGQDSMLWMLVSWVFSRKKDFTEMARLAIKHSRRPISAESIPFPPDVLAQIDEARMQGLDQIFSATYKLLDSLYGESSCSFECSAMRLGALTKALARSSLLAPREARPYLGHSIDSVKVKIENFRIPQWASRKTRPGSNKKYWCNHSCNVVWDLRPAVAVAEAQVDAWVMGDSIPAKDEMRDRKDKKPEPSCAPS